MDRYTAIKRGLDKYNTNKPCKRGHLSDRYTSSGACIRCLRESNGDLKPMDRIVIVIDHEYHDLIIAFVDSIRLQYLRAERPTRVGRSAASTTVRPEALAKWIEYFRTCTESDRQYWITKARKPKACQAAIDSLNL